MESKALKSLKNLAPQVGLEPTTLRLTAVELDQKATALVDC